MMPSLSTWPIQPPSAGSAGSAALRPVVALRKHGENRGEKHKHGKPTENHSYYILLP